MNKQTFERTTVQLSAQRQLMLNIKNHLESTEKSLGFFPSPEIQLMSFELGFAVMTLLEDGIHKTKHYQVAVDDITDRKNPQDAEANFEPCELLKLVHDFVKSYENLEVGDTYIQANEYQNKKSYGFTVKSDDRTLTVLVLDHKQIVNE
jgi:hypothetical protein